MFPLYTRRTHRNNMPLIVNWSKSSIPTLITIDNKIPDHNTLLNNKIILGNDDPFSNGCESHTNGELLFFIKIKDHTNIIFDIGCRNDSDFIYFHGEVHYFEPDSKSISELSNQINENQISILL